ncbi:GNAT family N-acetyltransferase [Paenibacillus sp. sptzw28]|uniref:GNAT family N-acetyltransferase n=1 Tax=Paenibacillus sp. sptzw28 TaxID=715179 RepID=UPI001C6E2CA6|nr:GNAT family N-acetyltransferase [Paenibacillus sp. sptzw28]QYR23505.1 GNAT family N-acetyltransferase [Paenibacillus sp. sptzw28]
MYKLVEELALNGWPALQTTVMDGWLLRTADGYTSRANSVNPIYPGVYSWTVNDQIREAERYYLAAGQDVIFKITPFVHPVSLDDTLAHSGYRRCDLSKVLLRSLDGLPEPKLKDAKVEESLSEDWLKMMAGMKQLTDSAVNTTRKMLSVSRLRQSFITLYLNGVPACCGVGVIERGFIGLYDIVVDPAFRNRGFGEQLILHLLQWGRANGAGNCYLLVAADNIPAVRLYEKLGFKEIYTYWYRTKSKEEICAAQPELHEQSEENIFEQRNRT